MTARHIPVDDIVQVLGCEIEKRPPAPGFDELVPIVRQVMRSPGELALEFPEDALATVEAFVVAEQQCCPGIGWEVEAGPTVTLRIAADDAVLDAISSMFSTESIEEAQ